MLEIFVVVVAAIGVYAYSYYVEDQDVDHVTAQTAIQTATRTASQNMAHNVNKHTYTQLEPVFHPTDKGMMFID